MMSIVSDGGILSPMLMLHSTHVRMINEAIVSLTVMTATLAASDAAEADDNNPDAEFIHRNLHIDLVINGIKRCFCDESLNVPFEVKVTDLFSGGA